MITVEHFGRNLIPLQGYHPNHSFIRSVVTMCHTYQMNNAIVWQWWYLCRVGSSSESGGFSSLWSFLRFWHLGLTHTWWCWCWWWSTTIYYNMCWSMNMAQCWYDVVTILFALWLCCIGATLGVTHWTATTPWHPTSIQSTIMIDKSMNEHGPYITHTSILKP